MIRFAILAGVSTDAQATPDKLSIPDQIKHCREKMTGQGIETAGPFVMDGYSRTGYDSLEVAMREIPPLDAAIQDAARDQYDILVMDNFDRLGDLGFIVMTRFKKLRKQLYSVRQSPRLVHPKDYDPYDSESDETQMHIEGILQAYRINKLRRGWKTGVPDRARKGLHPLSIPFGYRSLGKDQPVQQVPEEAGLIREMISCYLKGTTIQSIVDLANASGVPPRRAQRWSITVVNHIIHNPFYAGSTTFGKLKTVQGKRIPVPPSEWVTGTGQHQPIIDHPTWLSILIETERREGLRSRGDRYALTGLLSCALCGSRLHRHGKIDRPYPVDLSCPQGHVHIQYRLALQFVAQRVTKELQTLPPAEDPKNALERFQRANSALLEQRQQIQDGYEARVYSLFEAQTKIVAIETELDRLARQRDRAAQQHQQRAQVLQLASQNLTDIHAWILQDDPATVNHFLTALCKTITISPMYDLELVWR